MFSYFKRLIHRLNPYNYCCICNKYDPASKHKYPWVHIACFDKEYGTDIAKQVVDELFGPDEEEAKTNEPVHKPADKETSQ